MTIVVMLGSALMAREAVHWPRAFDRLLAINNAHALRPDWDYAIYPWDFPAARVPQPLGQQRLITETDFVPAQNAYGGFVYAGATMAFTAAYWALHALRPRVIAAFGCDMHYPAGQTHFYGTGQPDPLRGDLSLRNLEAKSVRLMALAAAQGCAMVNLSHGPSRLMFPRATLASLAGQTCQRLDDAAVTRATDREAALGYATPTGRYWEDTSPYDLDQIDALDALWLACAPGLAGLMSA